MRALSAVCLGVVLGTTPSHVAAQGCGGPPSQCGQWAGSYDLASYLSVGEEEFAHFVVIGSGPNAGKILLWCYNPTVLPGGPQSVYLWDPARPRSPEQTFTVDSSIFCGAQTWMSDASLLWVGGTDIPATIFWGAPVGVRNVRRLDPSTLTTSHASLIALEFWYESAISLADGRVLMTGTADVPILTPVQEQGRQFFSLAGGWTPWDDNGFRPEGFPRFHVLQSRMVLMTGYRAQARILDTQVAGPAAWTAPPGLLSSTDRGWGSSVYLSYFNAAGVRVERVIVIGGEMYLGTAAIALSSIEVLDNPDAPGAAWQTNPAWNMTWARSRLNAVILPDRTVLVIGGGGHTLLIVSEHRLS